MSRLLVLAPRCASRLVRPALLAHALLAAFSLPAAAAGFNSCLVPQKDVVKRGGLERPASRAFDEVCVAVLPPTCRDFVVDGKPCAFRSCVVPDSLRECPNGDMVSYTAESITPYVAQSVKPITPAELAAMNRAIDAEAKRLAAKWTDNGRVPLGPGAQQALQNVSCQLVAFGNPDVRCVPR